MAETQTVTDTSAPKNPVGRPRKDGQPAGTAQEPPAQQGEDLLLLLPSITPEEWQYRQLYLYRLYPITDRRGAGQPVYLCKYSETVDKDRIKRDYGSGIYKLELLLTLPNERGKKLAAAMFQIVDMDFPPKVPAGEWVDDPRNADWQWCRPRLGPQANGVAQVESVADAILRAQAANRRDETPALLAALAPLLDPKRQTDMIAQFAALMKPQDGTLTTILPLLLKLLEKPATDPMLTMLIEDRKTMAAEMAELRKSMMTPQKHPLEFLFEHEELGKRLFGRGAGGASSEGKTWVDIVEKGIDKLAPGINTLAQAGAAFAMRGTQPTPVQPNPARTITVQPQPTPPPPGAPPPSNAPVPAPAQPSESTSQETQEMNLGQLIQKYGPLLNQVTPFLMDQYAAGGEFGGYEFRDWFLSRHGQLTYSAVAHDLGVEGLLQIAKMNPQLWESLQPEQRFRAFFTDFFTEPGKERSGYADEPDENENDLEPDEPENEFEVRP